jgi:hypothetical protein
VSAATTTSSRGQRARFLFRTEAGTIDQRTWRFHAGWLAALAVGLTAIWTLLRPYAHHDLATSPFIVPMTIVAFTYLILFSFALILIAISYTMLSMKRLRALGQPTGLAGLVPLLALCAGSLHFLRDQTPDVITLWYVVALDVVLAAVVVATVYDLGFRRAPGEA